MKMKESRPAVHAGGALKGEPGVTQESGTSLSLLQRIKNGDNSGWQRVVELYSPLARHWCRRWDIEGADADDVLQGVFRSAAESIATFRREGEKDTFRGWLRGITRHRILAFCRNRDLRQAAVGGSDAQQRLHEIPEPAADSDSEEAEHFSTLVHRALIQLRGEFEPRSWQAFWRTAVDDQPSRDVAAELGMSANAVRMAKSRVLRRLREELGDLVE
jgi:RNA polymerase sigma-70 factor (ECF subfamily)